MSESPQLGPLLEPLTASAHAVYPESTAESISFTPGPSDSALPPTPFLVLCLEDYHSDDPIYLSFRKDELLLVLDWDSRPGWWQAQRTQPSESTDESKTDIDIAIGWIPQAYVQPLPAENYGFEQLKTEMNFALEPGMPDPPANPVVDYCDDFLLSTDEWTYSELLPGSSSRLNTRVELKPKPASSWNRQVRFINDSDTECDDDINLETSAVPVPFDALKTRYTGGGGDIQLRIWIAGVEANSLRRRLASPYYPDESSPNSETGGPSPALFNGSEQFSINGGAFNAVGGDIHETKNSGNTSFFNCIFNSKSSSDPRKQSSSSTTTPQNSKSQEKKRKRRWSITKFTHIFHHVYHHHLQPAVIYYPMSWMMYYVPWFVPWCQKCAVIS
ncbi:hypothetical protein F5879DRAFT_531720 [Lentinula edodes]|uniref:uncharacterized protein n=1 Tax=Lentinula edodes TaxID=5353 RepID=UPI001E8E646C|nr:uncharacterized protein C8R40DRAFT_278996 [Lentinula edodes]KAH7880741.1 hypothetical protein C8R40DRAFT_278996 [Lentinula edodes]KAJ3907372.1 hypothetical protein F5879DRAFT_531720 [Lentinula edodes]